jgi:hypothetical protein
VHRCQIRRLFDYLELDFEPGVLQFQLNPSPVATASAVQVRQPLHTGSIDSWLRYEQELQPVRQRLIELGVTVEP